jgi:hypothetical protein
MAMILAPARLRLAHGSTLILLTMPLGVLIAQIDTSVVNLAVKEIGTRLGAGVTALQWVVDACNLVSRSGDARDRLRPRPQRRSGERRRSRQCPRGALGRRVRSRQHRAHDRRHARDRGSRRGVCDVRRRRRRREPQSSPGLRPLTSAAASAKCSAPRPRLRSFAATRCIRPRDKGDGLADLSRRTVGPPIRSPPRTNRKGDARGPIRTTIGCRDAGPGATP